MTHSPSAGALALAIAGGKSVAAWCRETGTPRRTAYRMSRSPECRRLVEQIRRRAVDRAIGELARNASMAARQITRLASKAQSEAVQLAASRAAISDLLAITNHAELAKEIREIKDRLSAQEAKRNAKRKP